MMENSKLLYLVNKCEDSYVKNFSHSYQCNDFTQYQDYDLPNMYCTNYIWLNQNFNYKEIKEFVARHIMLEKQKNKRFLSLLTNKVIDKYLPYKFIKDEIEVYLLDKNDFDINIQIDNPHKIYVKDFATEYKNNKAIKDVYLKFDLAMHKDKDGYEFCVNKINKQINVLLNNPNIKLFLFFIGDEMVGKVELFYNNDIVKFDEFVVSTFHQGKRIGSFIINSVFKSIFKSSIRYVYLLSGNSCVAKKMYQKNKMKVLEKKYLYTIYW